MTSGDGPAWIVGGIRCRPRIMKKGSALNVGNTCEERCSANEDQAKKGEENHPQIKIFSGLLGTLKLWISQAEVPSVLSDRIGEAGKKEGQVVTAAVS